MSERRITRSSSKKQSKEQQLTESIKPPSVTQLHKSTKERNIDKLNEFFTLKLTNQEKEEYTKQFPEEYMWDYKLWKNYLFESIEKDDLNAVLLYLEKVTDFNHLDNLDFMTEILDRMRDMKRDYIFWNRSYWNKLKIVLKPETTWWYNHLYASLDNPEYIKKLMDHSWKVISRILLTRMISRNKPNYDLINYLINRIYANDDLSEYRFHNHGFQSQQQIANTPNSIRMYTLYIKKEFGLTPIQQQNVRYFLKHMILERGKLLPPLQVRNIDIRRELSVYDFEEDIYLFIMKCLETNETSILDSFVKIFDIKLEVNDKWFKFLLECIIRPDDFKKFNYAPRDLNIEDVKKLVSYLIKAYKINLNNVYIYWRASNIGNTRRSSTMSNPNQWLLNNIPVMAWAVLYKNKDAIDFFIEHGAILNRCVISMQDLTDDPAILGRFERESKARKIQRAFTQHLYSPSHRSQQQRATAFKEKYQTTQSMPPIEEEQVGGKKKKTLKKLKKRA